MVELFTLAGTPLVLLLLLELLLLLAILLAVRGILGRWSILILGIADSITSVLVIFCFIAAFELDTLFPRLFRLPIIEDPDFPARPERPFGELICPGEVDDTPDALKF